MINDSYYIARNGNVDGPFTVTQMKSMWKTGVLNGEMQCTPAGVESWNPLSSLRHVLEPAPLTLTKRPGSLTVLGKIGVVLFGFSAVVSFFVFPLASLLNILLSTACWMWLRNENAKGFTLASWVWTGVVFAVFMFGLGAWDWWSVRQKNEEKLRIFGEQQKIIREGREKHARWLESLERKYGTPNPQ